MPPRLRRVYDLRANDFRDYPVWTHAYGVDADEPWYENADVDEVTYRPWMGELPYDCTRPMGRTDLVAARFALADKTRLEGFFYTPTLVDGDRGTAISYVQPSVFLPDGNVCAFWTGGEPMHSEQRHRFYGVLGKPASRLFPIHYEALPGLLNIEFRGTIEGFAYLAKDYRTVAIER